jgi:hypothetical protein
MKMAHEMGCYTRSSSGGIEISKMEIDPAINIRIAYSKSLYARDLEKEKESKIIKISCPGCGKEYNFICSCCE